MGRTQIPGAFAEWLAAVQRGEKELPKHNGERHHYVPEFVLRRFGKGRRLFQLDKQTGVVESITPKEAAWDSNLYTVESVTGEHDGVVEALFSLAENYAARPLGTLLNLNSPADLADGDRGDLAFLIAIQEQRTPGFLGELTELVTQMGVMWAATELGNVKGSQRARQRGRDAADAITSGKVIMTPTKENVLEVALMMLTVTANEAYQLPWTLYKARGGYFVCSDRPLTRRDPTPRFPWSGTAWRSSPNVETTIPLSTSRCLRISPMDSHRLAIRPAERLIERINLRTYGWATRYVYGPTADVLEALRETALADSDAVPAPTKHRSVIVQDPATADPAVAAGNAARGWGSHVIQRSEDGSERLMSYEVIESVEDARRAVAPRQGGTRDQKEWPVLAKSE